MSDTPYRTRREGEEALNSMDGLDPRLSESEVKGPMPKTASFAGAERRRMAREVANAASIDGPPSNESQNRYGVIVRASRLIRNNTDEPRR